MATSNTEIANLALSHLGWGKELGSLDNDRSAEASACRRFFETARKATIRDGQWPFATKIADLTLVEENPNDEWGFSYVYPTDCLGMRRILNGTRNAALDEKTPFRVAQDSSTKVVFTDMSDATAEYSVDVDNYEIFPEDFILAFSFRLAAYIAPRVTAGDPFKLGVDCLKKYKLELSIASANAWNEQQDEALPESEFIRGRT